MTVPETHVLRRKPGVPCGHDPSRRVRRKRGGWACRDCVIASQRRWLDDPANVEKAAAWRRRVALRRKHRLKALRMEYSCSFYEATVLLRNGILPDPLFMELVAA